MTTRNLILLTMAVLVLPVLFSACSSSTTTPQISQPLVQLGAQITGDTLGGYKPLKGTMLAGKTYYMDSDIIVNAGDTLYMQPGVTLIALCGPAYYPEIQMYGTFISNGTAAAPNYMTVLPSKKLYSNLTVGLWGGIQCGPSSGDLILKFTHLEYCGGSGTAVVGGSAKTPYVIYFENPAANFIMEDSWVTGAFDDPVRVAGGKISLFRNVMEGCSGGPTNASGDGFNCKTGTVGDIAYNLFIGCCTNGPKLANKNAGPIQCHVNIYNNTIVTCGWRYVGTGRAGSTDIEDGAKGIEYNNIIVNCFTGFRLCSNPLADTNDTYYDYQWCCGVDSISVSNFYPHDGVSCQVPMPHDHVGASGANNPMFASYNINAVATSHYIYPSAWSAQDEIENVKNSSRFADATETFNSDFHLATGSPCIGTAFTGPVTTTSWTKSGGGVTVPVPMAAVTSIYSASNPFGAKQVGLGKDFGAYQTDGSGNVQ